MWRYGRFIWTNKAFDVANVVAIHVDARLLDIHWFTFYQLFSLRRIALVVTFGPAFRAVCCLVTRGIG